MTNKNPNNTKSWSRIVQVSIGMLLALILARLVSFVTQNNLHIDSPDLVYKGSTITINFFPLFLNLVIGGSLGGLLYSMLVDQVLEFPVWTENKEGIKPGFIFEIFLGIVGATIVYAYLFLIARISTNSNDIGILTFVAALVGGYGAKTLLDAVSKKFIEQVETVNLKETLEKRQKVKDIQRLANLQIAEGLQPPKLSELKTNLQTADKTVKERVFAAAREARRLGARVKAYSDRINRTIPIFESLAVSDPTDDRYQAQLGCAFRDALPPELDKAIDKLTEAINRRPTSDDNWHYELDRAVALIQKSFTEPDSDRQDSFLSQQILDDLKTIEKNYGLNRIALEFDEGKTVPIGTWLTNNQAWLKNNPEGSQLLKKGLTDASISQATTSSINIDDFDWENAPENSIIKAVAATYLKKQPVQSSDLSPKQTVFVPVDKEYKLVRYAQLNTPKTNKGTAITPGKTQSNTSIIPQSGLDVIKKFEGYHKKLADGRAQAYPDPGPKGWSLPTIGYGTTRYPNGQPVRQRDIITHEQAEEYLMDYVDKKCRTALEKIATWSQMNDNQRGALYSFAYNLGAGFYKGSGFQSITRVCDSPELWNNKSWVEQQFVKYVKADGKTLPGLVRRRKAEAQLFCTPGNSNSSVTSNNKNLPPVSEVTSAHCLVELDYGAGTWYIWSSHWDLPWVEQTNGTNKKKGVPGKPTHDSPAVQRQIDRLSKYLPAGKVLNLDIKTTYYSQRDNYRDRDRSCNSSSNAMYLDWLKRVTGQPGLNGDNDYLRKVFSRGDTTIHAVQTWALEQYGFRTKWMMDRDLSFVEELIKMGFPVVVNILHRGPISRPKGGHIIMLIGRQDSYWIAHDPYGTLKSDYKNHNGKHSQISEHEFKKRWQGGYRTLRD